jgi:hypothetical protein
MKVRQAYEGRVIEARSSELKNGGWDCEFSIEEHETTGVTDRAFYVPGVFPTAEAAIEAAVTAGQRKIRPKPGAVRGLLRMASSTACVHSMALACVWCLIGGWNGVHVPSRTCW